MRGLLRALGYTNKLKSPTYTLVEVHVVSGLNLYHFDFYRFNQPEEYLEAGLDEYFQASGPNAGVLSGRVARQSRHLPAASRPAGAAFAVAGELRLVELHALSEKVNVMSDERLLFSQIVESGSLSELDERNRSDEFPPLRRKALKFAAASPDPAGHARGLCRRQPVSWACASGRCATTRV